jgi:hypothetical protein
MTKEERVFIEANDLEEIELACTNQDCGSKTKVSLSLTGDSLTLPYICPSCNTDWFNRGGDDPRKSAIFDLRRALKTLGSAEKNFNVRFRVHVESVQ